MQTGTSYGEKLRPCRGLSTQTANRVKKEHSKPLMVQTMPLAGSGRSVATCFLVDSYLLRTFFGGAGCLKLCES